MQQIQAINNKAKGAQQQADADEAAQNWPGCFRHVARCRRLNKEEVVLILSNPAKFGLVRTEVLPAEGISSGTVYLCSKDRVRVLKHDGIDYVKRNAAQGSNRIREDVVKMKVNGRHAVNSYSSRGSGSACFWRRRYALEPPTASSGNSKSGRGHQNVVWGDQLVHYLDDEEARGFARRSPFGAAGVARPLTSEECWRGRGAQLPPDGNLFLAATRRESRREDIAAAAAVVAAAAGAAAAAAAKSGASPASSSSAASPSTKALQPSRVSSSIKKEDDSVRAGGSSLGSRGWIGAAGKLIPGARSCGSTSGGVGGSSRYGGAGGTGDARGAVPHNTVWGGGAGGSDAHVMGASNGHGLADAIGTAMVSPAATRLAGGGSGQAGGPGGISFWEAKKGVEFQQQQQAVSSALSHGGFYDDIGGLEFEGLGAGDVSGGAGGSHTDDDMNDLFRSFLVDGDDLLNVPSSQGNHPGSNQAPTELPAPAGFSLRNPPAGGGRMGGGTYEADDGVRGMRRRANTSPECDDNGVGSSAQGLRLSDVPFRPISPQGFPHRTAPGMLPALVGSPPRRESRPAANSLNNPLHNHGSRGASSPSPRCFPVWHNGGVSVSAAGGSESCAPGPLQLSSPWAQSYGNGASSGGGTRAATNSSPSPGRHSEAGGGLVPPTLSPPGAPSPALLGNGGAAAAIADFSPTWDFAPGGAKLLICLASPLDAEVGSPGPMVFFADRPVQSELVSQTVVRCRVPPGPGAEGTGRVTLRVEVSPHSNGLRRSNSSNAGFDAGSRGRGSHQGVVVFEYREHVSSPSNSAPAMSRCGTPRTPGRLLTWQELPEDGRKRERERESLGARKREWGELASNSLCLDGLYSPMSSSWADRVRRGATRSSTPRPRETPPWGSSARPGGRGPLGSAARRSPPLSWRRASADFGQLTVPPGQPSEDSLGYALLPCDGRECKIRIVERLGEISGSRSHGMALDEPLEEGKTGSTNGGSASGKNQGTWTGEGGGGGGCSGSGSDSGMSRDIVQQTSLGREGSMSSSGVGVGDLDDMALNELGDTELEGLLEDMWMKVMGQLTDLESELNALDTRGFSVLHYTCLHNLSALVPVLLERGADVDLRTGDGHDQTPLHLAAKGGSINIAQELCKKGAAVDAIDAHGLTADKLASRCNHRDVALWLWAQGRSGGASGAHPHTSSSDNNNHSAGSTPATVQDSPATPIQPPWAGGVSPAGVGCPPSPCPPPSPWSGDGWQSLQSPPAAPEVTPSPPEQLPPSDDRGFSPARGNSGDNAAGGADELPAFMGQEWAPGHSSTNGGKVGPGGSVWSALEEAGGGVPGDQMPWGLGLPPPGSGVSNGAGEMNEGDENDSVDQGAEEHTGYGSSMERLLRDSFSSLSLHEKCAISLHVSQQQQQHEQQAGGGGAAAAGGDASSGGVNVSELSGLFKVLAGGHEGGLSEDDLRAIMNIMGPSDLSEVEDEVKVIQQDVRAWILRCNYKSLRKAARTLQTAWRERQRHRIEEDSSPFSAQSSSLSCTSSRSGMASAALTSTSATSTTTHTNSMGNSLMADGGGGPEPMDESGDAFAGGVRDASCPESGSDAGGGGAGGNSGSGGVSLTLGAGALAEERATREERAAKALQSAARVMLARKGRFQRLAKETQALLLIQRRSREWLKQKETPGSDASADAPFSQGL